EEVKVLGEQSKPRGDVEVRTKIVGGANNGAIVDYRMRNGKDGWRIIDVVIEGISLVANFRDQFREVIARGARRRSCRSSRRRTPPQRRREGCAALQRAQRGRTIYARTHLQAMDAPCPHRSNSGSTSARPTRT